MYDSVASTGMATFFKPLNKLCVLQFSWEKRTGAIWNRVISVNPFKSEIAGEFYYIYRINYSWTLYIDINIEINVAFDVKW